MNGAAKMLMIQQARKGGGNKANQGARNEGGEYSRMEYARNESNYGQGENRMENQQQNRMENRSQNRMEERGETRGYAENGLESRRRRDRRGRFMEGEEGPDMRSYNSRYNPEGRRGGGAMDGYEEDYEESEMYGKSPESRIGNIYALPRNERPSRVIGFVGRESYGSAMHYGDQRQQEHKIGKTMEIKNFDQDIAHEWTKGMKNADGSSGPHWTFDQAKTIMAQHNISGIQPAEFWAVLNSLYSDYYRVAKKFGVDRPDFYSELAKAWIEDKDAVDDKAAAYFEYIVRK